MTELSIRTRGDVAASDCAGKPLMAANCCIDLCDQVAQGLDRDVLRLLNGIAGRVLPDPDGRSLSAALTSPAHGVQPDYMGSDDYGLALQPMRV